MASTSTEENTVAPDQLLAANEEDISECVGTGGEPSQKRRRRTRVGFDCVEVYCHDQQLSGDRVPSSGGPSIGLGKVCTVFIRWPLAPLPPVSYMRAQ